MNNLKNEGTSNVCFGSECNICALCKKCCLHTRSHTHTESVLYMWIYSLSFKLCIVGDITENEIIARVALKEEVFLSNKRQEIVEHHECRRHEGKQQGVGIERDTLLFPLILSYTMYSTIKLMSQIIVLPVKYFHLLANPPTHGET